MFCAAHRYFLTLCNSRPLHNALPILQAPQNSLFSRISSSDCSVLTHRLIQLSMGDFFINRRIDQVRCLYASSNIRSKVW